MTRNHGIAVLDLPHQITDQGTTRDWPSHILALEIESTTAMCTLIACIVSPRRSLFMASIEAVIKLQSTTDVSRSPS